MSGRKNQKTSGKKSESSGWSKAEDELKKIPRDRNEGEGNKSAALIFDRSESEFAKSGDVEGKAKEAESALEGPERDELERAEKIAKSHSRGEDPSLFRKAAGTKTVMGSKKPE